MATTDYESNWIATSGTLASRIADQIRHLVITGQITPGERLLMRDLSERFRTSYAPIREALNRLEGESLVEYRPRKGVVVIGLDLHLLGEVYYARRLAEPELVARAAALHTDERLSEICALAGRLEDLSAAGQGHSAEWYTMHRRFHWLLIEPAANSVLEPVLRQWWAVAERFHRAATMSGPLGTPEIPRVSHDTLAAVATDAEKIGKMLDQHLRVTEQTLRERYCGSSSAGLAARGGERSTSRHSTESERRGDLRQGNP